MLWDVGYYTIEYPGEADESDSEEAKRRKRRRVEKQSER